ncbi:hypothetical protein BXZ70DRAFT_316802 [Cristinia sonorae]|uniref:Uncharacterized protein n=1 Tax=Cristinia sonorae TaxID=1940300 RepID=A0A8K0XNI4_9AGAR|nr:hypothetical protein BXZ70DRAFT_316802 [Cristinia sonorae]
MYTTISLLILSSILSILPHSSAYIPAYPVNDPVSPPDASGTNGTSPSESWLNMTSQSYNGGGFALKVSYSVVGAKSNGLAKGPFLHFSETNLTEDTTTTPWIALVSCDSNSTNASTTTDIFTLARQRGAIAAFLYSLYGERCEISRDYADPTNFDNRMDIFSAPMLTASQFIEDRFAVITTKYRNFNATLLNDSAAEVNATLFDGPVAQGFMFASLRASNATADGGFGDLTPIADKPQGNGGNPNTGLELNILYATVVAVLTLLSLM